MLAPLRPPVLLWPALAILLLCVPSAFTGRARVFGATMTSALGESFANGIVDGCGGTRALTIMFAVEVGERCNVSGCTR